MMGMRNIVSSMHHTLTGLLWTDGTLLKAPIMDIPHVIDPVGVGDAFMGGWMHAIQLFPNDRQKQLDYSLADRRRNSRGNGGDEITFVYS